MSGQYQLTINEIRYNPRFSFYIPKIEPKLEPEKEILPEISKISYLNRLVLWIRKIIQSVKKHWIETTIKNVLFDHVKNQALIDISKTNGVFCSMNCRFF